MLNLHRSSSRGSRALNTLAAGAGRARLAMRHRSLHPPTQRGPLARILRRS